MKKKFNLLATCLLASVISPSCISMLDSKSDRQAIEACSSNADCSGGLECEIEHGVGTCQPHGGQPADPTNPAPSSGECQTDADCGAGLECEVEHGTSFCQPHGSGDDQPVDPSNPTPPAGECQTDADCGAGLECEIEHGTSFCQPHGGDDN